ncbi:arf-GAP with SH3 domain, ANK repeat and PH domain-containing protein 1-like isoform 2-T2 [Hipposideros larvatus]
MAHTLKQSIKKLAGDIVNIKQTQDEEKKQLTSLRDLIKSSLQVEQKEDSQCRQVVNSLQQQHGNKEYRVLKIDYLLKKSTGIRKVWQRRMCAVRRGTLIVPHAATNRQATTVDLLTCQVKPDTKDDRRFYVISQNRTYHLQAKDQQECAVWISALRKSKEEAQTMAFREEERENSLEDDTNAIEDVQRIPGDDMCCDSGSAVAVKYKMKNHLSLDRATTIQPPPDVTTKPRCADLPQKKALPPKPQLGDVLAKSQAEDVPPEAQPPPDVTTKPHCADLPQKKTLPPKPQLGDVLAKSQAEDVPSEAQPPPDATTKPHCADLPQKKTLPPKPQLGDVLAKSQAEGVPPEALLPPDVTTKPRPVDLCPKGPTGDSIEKQASEDSNDLTPVPPP